MGEDEEVSSGYCPYASDRPDCDGDWDTYCTAGSCRYQHNVRDCNGDIVSLCRK